MPMAVGDVRRDDGEEYVVTWNGGPLLPPRPLPDREPQTPEERDLMRRIWLNRQAREHKSGRLDR